MSGSSHDTMSGRAHLLRTLLIANVGQQRQFDGVLSAEARGRGQAPV